MKSLYILIVALVFLNNQCHAEPATCPIKFHLFLKGRMFQRGYPFSLRAVQKVLEKTNIKDECKKLMQKVDVSKGKCLSTEVIGDEKDHGIVTLEVKFETQDYHQFPDNCMGLEDMQKFRDKVNKFGIKGDGFEWKLDDIAYRSNTTIWYYTVFVKGKKIKNGPNLQACVDGKLKRGVYSEFWAFDSHDSAMVIAKLHYTVFPRADYAQCLPMTAMKKIQDDFLNANCMSGARVEPEVQAD